MSNVEMQVVKNAKRNIYFGAINRIVVLIIPFIERTVMQQILGSQYLGLGSLFQSVIQVLSLSELGFSTAMVYNMYKPAAEGNVQKMNSLLSFYRRVYRIIGCVILGVGLILIPFLPRLIKGSYPSEIGLTELYLIYLVNTAISYFLFAYRTSLIVVHQRDDVNSTINSIVKIGLLGSQIAILLITKNYYLFSLLMPVFTIVRNLLIGWRTKTLFPQYRAEGDLAAEDKARIRKLVAGTFIHQACVVTRNSLDSICISALLGLTLTAIYNNYYTILKGVTSFVGIFTAAFLGGIGNHVATKSVEENFQEMKKLDFVYLWIGGWCAICLLCLYQPLMEIWMGKDMMLPMSAVVLFCSYCYLLKLGDVRAMYNSANGLWWEQRYRALGETLLNLILNITLGKFFGVHGIIIATMISLFLCNYIWSVSITFKLYFGKTRMEKYYQYQGAETLVMVVAAAVTYLICGLLPSMHSFYQLAARALICLLIPNIVYYIAFRRTEQFQNARKLLIKRCARG